MFKTLTINISPLMKLFYSILPRVATTLRHLTTGSQGCSQHREGLLCLLGPCAYVCWGWGGGAAFGNVDGFRTEPSISRWTHEEPLQSCPTFSFHGSRSLPRVSDRDGGQPRAPEPYVQSMGPGYRPWHHIWAPPPHREGCLKQSS